jgi:hypothetical protein
MLCSEGVADCYRRAAEARELADIAINDSTRAHHLERERQWLVLARTQQFAETLDLALGEVDRRDTRICPACNVKTSLNYYGVFVCTGCHQVIEKP